MEHEVYVPFPVGTVRQALAEPERLARCVPGAQLDADAAPGVPEGRLRLRIGGSTITYRGSLRVTPREDEPGTFDAAAHGTEVRGDGLAELDLTVRVAPDAGGKGTTLSCTAAVRAEGRLADAPEDAARTAGRRLLERFATTLTDDLTTNPVAGQQAGPDAAAGPTTAMDGLAVLAAGPAEAGTAGERDAAGLEDEDLDDEGLEGLDEAELKEAGAEDDPADVIGTDDTDEDDTDEVDGAGDLAEVSPRSGVFESEIPPSSLDPLAEDELGIPDEPPAEAAHARRTMIGRSAEEVDHAPPRGRYAPVPAPETSSASATLRWAAPAAAVVLASAVVVGRALRRRR
ncbi:SRPBCC domain-containing protein [Streptomyces ochraceiscleroticus]|uniref:SRPBCC domain-containing protein n=1 Tax=Streptomyces ochraceiscleroticus TaxID=47761 RepID=A0ABW1MPB0_9ACTN|nr:SRPBCC domain-containing protein [Streptomyces ochraceiscleroticus]